MGMVLLRVLEDRFQADLWVSALTAEGIPHLLRPYTDTAYDGLFVSQRGYASLFVEEDYLESARLVDRDLESQIPAVSGRPADLARAMDHTLLDPDADLARLEAHLAQCLEHQMAAACISPWMVGRAARVLSGSPVAVCSVVAFPLGTATARSKVQEALDLAREGATELDMVFNRGLVASGRLKQAVTEVRQVVEAVAPAMVKVILEVDKLGPEMTREAARALMDSGAAFLKTGTGHAGPARPGEVALLRAAAPDLPVKAAGGIRDLDGALALLEAGATRLGSSNGHLILEEARRRWPAKS